MKVVGLDLSTRSIGIGLASQDGVCAYLYKPESSKLSTIVSGTLMSIERIIPKDKISAIFIENYAFGMFGKTASGTKLAEVGGGVKYVFEIIKIPVYMVAPTSIKKFATGRGNAKKDEIRLAVYKKYGLEYETSDECDALMIADFGYCVITNDQKNLTKTAIKQITEYRSKYGV